MLNLVYHIKNSGYTAEKLAEKTGITVERLASIINGSIEPNMSDIRKISRALKLSIDFLTSTNEQFQEINLLFRKAITNERDKPAADKFSHIIGNSFTILSDNISPRVWLEKFPAVENTYLNAEKLAMQFREMFLGGDNVSPVLHLPQIIANDLNCIVYVTDLGKGVDGASAIISGVPFIFVSLRFVPRMLFTLAHELAHIIAHHEQGDFARFDKTIPSLQKSTFKDEAFANAFASCLLLPRDGLGVTLKKIREHFHITGDLGDIEILYLCRIYGVSFEVAARRCEDLDLLPRGGAISLYEKLKESHESPEKRAKELGIQERPPIEFPKVSPKLIAAAIDKINTGEVSLGKASEILSMPINEILNHHSLRSLDE